MNKSFDPAPVDKHAENSRKAGRTDKTQHEKLDQGLEETFPASDPPSAMQPKSK